MPGYRRDILVVLAILVAAAAIWVINPPGGLSRNAIHDFFLVRLPRNFAEAMTPQGGERVLPPEVQEAIALLRSHGVDRYRASDRLAHWDRSPDNQRLVEGAWPIRPADGDTPWYLAFADETLPAQCSLVERRDEFVLARCP